MPIIFQFFCFILCFWTLWSCYQFLFFLFCSSYVEFRSFVWGFGQSEEKEISNLASAVVRFTRVVLFCYRFLFMVCLIICFHAIFRSFTTCCLFFFFPSLFAVPTFAPSFPVGSIVFSADYICHLKGLFALVLFFLFILFLSCLVLYLFLASLFLLLICHSSSFFLSCLPWSILLWWAWLLLSKMLCYLLVPWEYMKNDFPSPRS